ncbi:hypothetical protein [Mycolicibacterium sp. P1-18]|uniref:hypothetical protein n=1 Tax=Mycolicibacterium sp. P1-18 TaxID=2024615 RepID=UPI0011F10911|nr:hypothetical protein [Mycolicibacterium sp. P1-18]
MATVTISGDIPNLTLILEDISSQVSVSPDVTLTIEAAPHDGDSFGHAEWGELMLTFGEGALESLAARAVWAALSAAVRKARRRGQIETSIPEELAGIEGLESEEIKPKDEGNGVESRPGSQ